MVKIIPFAFSVLTCIVLLDWCNNVHLVCLHMHCICLDDNELLEQMIKDTEALALEEDMSVIEEPEEEVGSGQGAEPSSGALLDEYLLR